MLPLDVSWSWLRMKSEWLVGLYEKENKDNREIKIHVYGTRQTANVSWEFLKIENKQIKTVQNDSFG